MYQLTRFLALVPLGFFAAFYAVIGGAVGFVAGLTALLTAVDVAFFDGIGGDPDTISCAELTDGATQPLCAWAGYAPSDQVSIKGLVPFTWRLTEHFVGLSLYFVLAYQVLVALLCVTVYAAATRRQNLAAAVVAQRRLYSADQLYRAQVAAP